MLEAEGFDHLTVNHSQNCVDPQSGAHTQKIEASWRALKLRLSKEGVNLKQDSEGLHFAEFLWFKTRQINNSRPEKCSTYMKMYSPLGCV